MSEWTVDTLKEHLDELRISDQRALQIKEEADKIALGLARDIQVYKDEKANELREQINSERGSYATKVEVKPLIDYVSGQQGRNTGFGSSKDIILFIGFLITMGIAIYSFIK